MVKPVHDIDYRWKWDKEKQQYVVYYKPYKISASGKTLKSAEKAILSAISMHKKNKGK